MFILLPRVDLINTCYFEEDIRKGCLKIHEALELLGCFWLKFNEIIRVDDKEAADINAGYASGQNYVVSGVNKRGEDSTNFLSYGGYLNFAKILELTLNDGKCVLSGKSSGLNSIDLHKIKSFDEFIASFKELLKKGIEIR